jgi:hypothetical protein
MTTSAVVLAIFGAILSAILALILTPVYGRPVERALVRLLSDVGRRVGSRELDLTGIWHSIYTYTTSDGPGEYKGHHYVVVRQFRDRVTVKSLDHPEGSRLWMDLEVDSGLVVTGRWREDTGRHLEFYGVVQMLVDPSRHAMAGLWLGYSRSRHIKANRWELTRVSTRKNRRERKRYTARGEREFSLAQFGASRSRVLGYPDEAGSD